jgi:hypothetical protein
MKEGDNKLSPEVLEYQPDAVEALPKNLWVI